MWSVADPDLQIRGRGDHPDPEIKGGGRGGGLKKKSFSALRASVWSENKGGGRAGPPVPHLDPPLVIADGRIRHFFLFVVFPHVICLYLY